jgi:hypothetical protein
MAGSLPAMKSCTKQNSINQLHATQINHHAITMFEKYIIRE